MKIGIPREIKTLEKRVGMTPASVREAVKHGHRVLVESMAGSGIGHGDEDYAAAGAQIVQDAEEVFASAELIVKVKEPQPEECKRLREGQLLFTYLHLAPDPVLAEALVESGCSAIAYETVTDARGGLPLLAPMSEVAGRMSIQAGAHALEAPQGGRGILLGGIPGVLAGKVLVLGGGVAGTSAARMAMGMEARVIVIDISLERLAELDIQFGREMGTVYATSDAIEEHVLEADVVVGCVLVAGAVAPKLVTREIVSRMKRGAVLVDVAIDQGGCFETSRPTTHRDPTYVVDGVIHYCVANMPGAVPRSATFALNNATLPRTLALADKGLRRALADDLHLSNGLNVHAGRITHRAVAESLGKAFTPVEQVIGH